MVVVEGVARGLDPSLNMWSAAEPVAREWIEDNLGPIGRLRQAGEGATTIGKVLADVPSLLTQMQQTAVALSEMARSGFRLDEETVRELAREEARQKRWGRVALWVGALSLAVLAATSLGWLG
jgi:ubiquinone biosynthesis protein